MTAPDSLSDGKVPRSSFPSTHWSVVLKVGGSDAGEADSALETLCRLYWYPLYSYVRRTGRTHHEAEDQVQAFFAHLLDNTGLVRASPERGRFRTFLLTALRNFLTTEWHRANAIRRGGGEPAESLPPSRGDERFSREVVDGSLTPEQAFDRQWTLEMIEHVLEGLRTEYEASGRGELYRVLAPLVWGGGPSLSLSAQALSLGLSESALKVALHRLRKRLRDKVRLQVAATVAAEAEVDDEMRHLLAVVAGKPSAY